MSEEVSRISKLRKEKQAVVIVLCLPGLIAMLIGVLIGFILCLPGVGLAILFEKIEEENTGGEDEAVDIE